ncbi:uncharacterized protein EI90DRAFT_3127887 [Cantharellus anzutake]|uniref:uncharacterized protein n=1 Tax=Cantharellus anzutake TaxID=1750568 RepID=UPI0019043FE7|nr:uncharacterized protein EI90DRAFT_3127887 [Cantharellus anzutake]KAF8326309.1 hypothetical protein EI90DRAFT_3127887 [Cantharellus anzutake]
MSFSLTQIQKAKTNAAIFLKRAFPGSQGTLTIIPAAKAMDQQGEEPLPWGIMIAGLMYCDAATLLHHQFWLSKAFCFVAYPATPFISTWIGNWAFAANENDKPAVIECLKSNLANAHTKIGKYLRTKIPDTAERLFIIESVKVQPINIIKQNSEATHWAFTVDSPHPTDANQHKQWITEAEATMWYHTEIATGELRNPRNTCKCCKGKDHSTYQCPLTKLPFWTEIYPRKNFTRMSTVSNNPIAEGNQYATQENMMSHAGLSREEDPTEAP